MFNVTNVNPENQNLPENDVETTDNPAADSSGLPLRGLAMVLIAVAVLLGLGGLYALTQTGDDNAAGDAGSAEQATETTVSQPQQQASETAGQEPEETPGERSEDDEQTPAPAGQGDNQPAGGANADAPVTVNVLNNSTVGGLAERIHGDLAADGRRVGEHGNLPENVAIVSETTVFFQPGDQAGERAANELAEQIGSRNGVPATAKPYIDGLPDEVTGDGQIVLVLIGEVSI